MALATYTDLQASIQAWVDRAGEAVFVANVPDIIALAEAKLNRELNVIETDATLTGVVGSRNLDITALALDAPTALFANFTTYNETLLTPKYDGTYEQVTTNGRPRYWSIDGTNIVMDRPLDGAYTFRFRYDQKFNLATTSTNWLLTNYPDVYLAACLAWSGAFSQDWVNGGNWKGVADEGIADVKSKIASRKRGLLTVDPALQMIGRRWRSNAWLNEGL